MKSLLIINPRNMNSQMDYIHHLNYFAANLDIDLFLICESLGQLELNKRIKIIEVKRRGGRFLFAWQLYKTASKLILSHNIDRIISSYGHFNSLLPFFLRKKRKKGQWNGALIYDLRSASVSHIFDNLQNKLFAFEQRYYDYCMAVSERTALKVFGQSGASAFICGVGAFPAGSYSTQHQLDTEISNIKEELQIKSDETILLYVGTLQNREIDRFINQLSFNTEKFRLLIIGDGDARSISKIELAISEKKLDDKAHLCGRIPFQQLAPYLRLSDIGLAYTPSHESLADQPMTKLYEYHEFELVVLTNDIKKYQFCPRKSIMLSGNDRLSDIISELQKKNDNPDCRSSLIYWEDWNRKLYAFLESLEAEVQ